MEQYLIVHYGELALKGGNKKYFTDALNRHLLKEVRQIGIKSQIQLILSRFVIKLPNNFDKKEIIDAMMRIPGIENFGFFYKTELDFDVISKALITTLPRNEISEDGLKTFCVRVKKSQIDIPFDRMEAERDLGAVLIDNNIGLKVKMNDPDLPVLIELFGDYAYISYKKYHGLGGLPVGTGGKVLSLISSGFDSPVAAFKMIRRGAKVHFVHFSGQPYSKQEEVEQVKDIVKILAKYQGETKLFIVPFGEIQKKISLNLDVPAKLRVVIYRRLMFKIAERISRYIKARALVTGESLGQVASQTLNNIFTIDQAANMPIFRPLIGIDKSTIINESVKIGTHDISKLPCTDTCSLFMPKSPEVSAKLKDVLQAEEKINIDEIVNNAFLEKEILKFNYQA
jgi:thiamine biosynthesis protein ThiI